MKIVINSEELKETIRRKVDNVDVEFMTDKVIIIESGVERGISIKSLNNHPIANYPEEADRGNVAERLHQIHNEEYNIKTIMDIFFPLMSDSRLTPQEQIVEIERLRSILLEWRQQREAIR